MQIMTQCHAITLPVNVRHTLI
jgi:hypothetical protein